MMSTSDKICKDGASKSNNDGVCEVNSMLQDMSTGDKDNNNISICANCGKEGISNNMNTCNKCNMVKYCNAVCKKIHKKKHKKDCEELIRRAAEKHSEELRLASEKHDIELFKDPPSYYGDCPICFLRMPSLYSGYRYYSCCGKIICSGCVYAPVYDNQGNEVVEDKCPFCRIPTPTAEKEILVREKKRVEANDPSAIHNLGCDYYYGLRGFPQDHTKALEYWHRAGELGYAEAYNSIGCTYEKGEGVEVDKSKAGHYYELGAMEGCFKARNNLASLKYREGNINRALKHFMIAVRGGNSKSVKIIKEMYSCGHATKEDYTKALQSYQAYLGEIKSPQRDKAAAEDEDCRYY